MNTKKNTLALIAGGTSGEREVSLNGAAGVEKALNRDKYDVRRYDPTTDLSKLAAEAKDIDVAFILLHGPGGEDGIMQGFLELLEIPYQGAGVLGSAIAMDKYLSKQLYRQADLPVPAGKMATREDLSSPDRILAELSLPLVIKPASRGSSLGMSIAKTKEELMSGISLAFEHDNQVMVEQFISGREITVGVLGNETLTALPLVEVIPGDQYDFFDYEAKYQLGATKEVCPAEVDDTTTKRAQKYGLTAHHVLHLRGYSRTDMIIQNDGSLYLLETNTIPGMTPTSLLPQAAAAAGYPFDKLLDRLIELAME